MGHAENVGMPMDWSEVLTAFARGSIPRISTNRYQKSPDLSPGLLIITK